MNSTISSELTKIIRGFVSTVFVYKHIHDKNKQTEKNSFQYSYFWCKIDIIIPRLFHTWCRIKQVSIYVDVTPAGICSIKGRKTKIIQMRLKKDCPKFE